MDVTTAFLHGSIKEEVYVEKPEGFEIYDQKSHVCRLTKSLYELKQAPRAWYERINSYLMKLGFIRSEVDPNLYFKVEDGKLLILVLYVDDLFLTDADPLIHKCNVEDRKSTFGCCFALGSASISWMSRKQKSVALSTAEAEYIVASMASCEAVWLRKLFSELFGFTLDTTVILCDNQSGIRLSENPVFHDRSKHIDIRYHYIRDMVQRGAIRLQHIDTDEQVIDILTKPLGKVKFLTFQEQLGIVQRPFDEGPI
eukprot:PITA_14274